jgi:hypothetical protein
MKYDPDLFPEKDKNGKPIVGSIECVGCATRGITREIPVKVNVNGCVYYYCGGAYQDETGKTKQCKTRFNMDQDASRITINEYLQTAEVKNVEQPEIRQEETTGAETAEFYTEQNGKDTDEMDEGRLHGGNTGGYATDKGHQNDDGLQQSRGFAAGLKHFITGDD